MSAPAECEPVTAPESLDSGGATTVATDVVATTAVEATSVLGLALGLLAATCYSITNIGLRQLSDVQDGIGWDLWICGIKALPTVLITGWMLQRLIQRGQEVRPSRRMLWMLFGTALMMQFGGNFGFQLALRAIGLAVSVPIVFASIICSGAVAGRMALGDPVGVRTGISMGLMVVSIAFLSVGAQEAAETATMNAATGSSSWSVLAGIVCGTISGISYGLGGVVIRSAVRTAVPVPMLLFVFGIVGLLSLCPLGAIPMGVDGVLSITGYHWALLLGAGLFNALGFFAITYALRYLNVNKANVMNAAQNAMCAVAGFALFAEPMTAMTLSGIGLTIVGLLILGRR
jgi:DME family drug/metabolite transporter